MNAQVLLIGAAVGALATLTMDVGATIGFLLGIAGRGPRRTGHDLIGRWVGYILQGRLKHADILQTPVLPGEIPLGVLAHYLIGIVLTLAYIAVLAVLQVTPTMLTAVMYGVATTVFPWFLLYPAWGYGWLGRKTPGGAHMTRTSLYNHVIFGLGLALWTAVLRPL